MSDDKSKKTTAGQRAGDDTRDLLRARNALLWVVTREEDRAERALAEAARQAQYQVKFWDCATGVTDEAGRKVDGQTDPNGALDLVRDSRKREVWVFRDLHLWLRDPTTLRRVRSLARSLPVQKRSEARAVVVLSPSSEVPPELAGHAVVIDWPTPDRAEVAENLASVVASMPDGAAAPDAATTEAAVDAAVGLSHEEASACFAKSIVTALRIDPALIAAEKRRVISREKVLEWHEPDPRGLAAVGGLEVLKDWLVRRRAAFSQRAREFGLPAPRGVLLGGVPGCGKSLTAKAVASAWGVPLLRLDLGALKSKWVGESEGNLRRALRVAEAVAPCVLWVDEIEKALAGATQGAADGGVSADALGAVLSWMQEREAPVFVVATSNEVRALPPELLRKGRFDEVFWVDLPTEAERADVLRAALARIPAAVSAGVTPAGVAEVAAEAADFTGSEVAALVPDALFAAFADGERPLAVADLLASARDTTPLARTSGDRISALREWAKGRARSASAKTAETRSRERQVDLEPALEQRGLKAEKGAN